MKNLSEAAGIPSPCVGLCRLDEHQVCMGCRRTLAEIAAWRDAGATEKLAVWARLGRSGRTLGCAGCSSDFVCGGDGSCWCATLPAVGAPDPALGDCRCPRCLKELLEGGADSALEVRN